VKNQKEVDEILIKNSRMIYDRLSKANYKAFASVYPVFLKSVAEDPSSNGNYYDIKYYVSKY